MSSVSSQQRGRDTVVRVDVSKVLERQPPQSLEAEMSLLGSMILDPRVIGDVVQVMGGADDFYKAAHGAIYQILVQRYDDNQPVDLVHLNEVLRDRGMIEQVGGVNYLLELAESVPSAANAVHYARLVRDKSLLRKLIDTAGKILYEAHTGGESVDTVLDKAEQEIFRIAETRTTQEASDLGRLVSELYEQLNARYGQGEMLTGLETGFFDFDNMTSGLQKGEMIIVAGRPSMGKTAWALSVAEHMAITRKQPVGVFSLEMGRQQLAQRLLCARSGVDSHRLRRNALRDEEFHQLAMTVGELSDAPLMIDDTPGLSLLALRAKARRMAARYDIKCLVIDYLQLMSCPGSESRQQEVSELSRGIKALARELSVPVICLSQLNRASESREGHKPRMSDLRESGSIEQDADMVVLLHREEYYHDDEWKQSNPDKIGMAEIIIAKQRNGPVGTVELQFNSMTTKFANRARSRESQEYGL